MATVCVIGGGVSGIAAVKVLRQRGLAPDAFEKGSQTGGLWRYGNDNGLSGIYESLRLNTSKTLTAFSDFPMPDDSPDYPDHRQFVKYLDAAIERFGLRSSFQFRTEVVEVSPHGSRWNVRLADGRTLGYDAVIVASGHHWKPRQPRFPGTFSGRLLHSHEYRTPSEFKNRRVLVVGIGNSAVDIACDVSRVATTTLLSTRRGAHVLPKYLLGLPTDRWGAGPLSYLPPRIQGWIVAAAVRVLRGSLSSYGLPEPAHRVEQAHPTVSSEFLGFLREGRIHVRGDVRELEGDHVAFIDGKKDPVDVIVAATGYEVSCPYLDPSSVELSTLYQHVISPQRPQLYFVGFVQPFQGPVLRTAEVQSRWVAGLIRGDYLLPDGPVMLAWLDRERRRRSMFVQTPRHGLEVDYHRYVRGLEKEMKRCRPPALTGN